MKLSNRCAYRLDYIGQDIFESFDNNYRKIRKTGCIYVFPKELTITNSGMISNFVDNDGEPLRIRQFGDYVTIEPTGIIITKENITPVHYEDIYNNNRKVYISANNGHDVRMLSQDTFFANYCENHRAGSIISKEQFNEAKNKILNNIKMPSGNGYLSAYDYACMLCYSFMNNGLNKIDMNLFNDYIFGLLTSKTRRKEVVFDRSMMYPQFDSLMYAGVLHTNYDKLGKKELRTYVDFFDADKNNGQIGIEEKIVGRYDELVISNSEIVKKYLQEKYEKNKEYYPMIDNFAKGYIDFQNKVLGNTIEKQNIKKK